MLSKEQIIKLKPKLEQFKIQREEARYTYLGMLSEYQLFIKEPKQTLVYTKLNPVQHFLFKRVLHGLKMYTKEEIDILHESLQKAISMLS